MRDGIIPSILLRALKAKKGLVLNKKPASIPQCYGEYNSLDMSQRFKVHQAWQALKDLDATTGTTEIEILRTGAIASSKSSQALSTNTRQAITTCSEMYRLILLLYHPDLRLLWESLRRPMNRSGLDASQSGEQSVAASSVNALTILTQVYNTGKYEGEILSFQNPLFNHDQHGEQLSELKETYNNPNISPFPLSTAVLGDRVKNINPSVFIPRTEKWISEKLGEIRSFLHKNYSPGVGFFRSGNQDGENPLTAWSDYYHTQGAAEWTDALMLTPDGTNFMSQNRDDGRELGSLGSA